MRWIVDKITGAEDDRDNEVFDGDNDDVDVYDVKNKNKNPTPAGDKNSSDDESIN